MSGRVLYLLLVLFTVSFGVYCSGYNRAIKSSDYDYKEKFADNLYKQGKYYKASYLYSSIINIYRNTNRYQNLLYKLAKSYYKAGDNYTALGYFQELISSYPFSPYVEEASFLSAMCHYNQIDDIQLDQTMTESAMNEMLTFSRLFNSSKYNDKALNIIKECRRILEEKDSINSDLYFKLGDFRASGIYFNNLLQDYPESPSTPVYKYKTIISYYNFAEKSIKSKQRERFQKVISECKDFKNLFPDNELNKEVKIYLEKSQKKIKQL